MPRGPRAMTSIRTRSSGCRRIAAGRTCGPPTSACPRATIPTSTPTRCFPRRSWGTSRRWRAASMPPMLRSRPHKRPCGARERKSASRCSPPDRAREAQGDQALHVDRRQVLAATGAALGMVVSRTSAKGPAMHTRPIHSTGEAMPVVGFGTWQTFDIGTGRAERAQRRQVLETLFAAGGRIIDSSPMYGRAEAVVGDLLAEMGARDKAFLATKVWTTGERAGLAQMQASAAKLRAQVIDLMQIHNLVDWRTQLRSLRAGKEAGRFRYIGITHYTAAALDDLAAIVRAERLDFVQMGYSLADRAA